MAWFNRQSDKAKEYLQETDTVSRPLAISFTVIIFFVGVAVMFSIFFGGRWVYQQIAKKDNPAVVETAQTNQSDKSAAQTNTNQSSGNPAQQTTAPQSNSQTNAIDQTPNTGPNEVPNTGPQPE